MRFKWYSCKVTLIRFMDYIEVLIDNSVRLSLTISYLSFLRSSINCIKFRSLQCYIIFRHKMTKYLRKMFKEIKQQWNIVNCLVVVMVFKPE